jgi:hypothetical protein
MTLTKKVIDKPGVEKEKIIGITINHLSKG